MTLPLPHRPVTNTQKEGIEVKSEDLHRGTVGILLSRCRPQTQVPETGVASANPAAHLHPSIGTEGQQ